MKRSKQKGQVTTELILMLVVFMAVVGIIAGSFNRFGLIASVVSGPWRSLAGMAQNGVWEDPQTSAIKHPNVYERWSTPQGDAAQ